MRGSLVTPTTTATEATATTSTTAARTLHQSLPKTRVSAVKAVPSSFGRTTKSTVALQSTGSNVSSSSKAASRTSTAATKGQATQQWGLRNSPDMYTMITVRELLETLHVDAVGVLETEAKEVSMSKKMRLKNKYEANMQRLFEGNSQKSHTHQPLQIS